MIDRNQHILIVGAGLCGGLLALRFAQLGFRVSLFEARGDIRHEEIQLGRSINLALSDRGLKALRLVGLEERIREDCIPMQGRMIHSMVGDLRLSPYSGRAQDFINSISRENLNRILLEKADEHDRVKLIFNAKCTSVDFDDNVAYLWTDDGPISCQADVIFGTDGAGSRVRRELLKGETDNKQDQSDFLTHGYKELAIPPTRGGGWRLAKYALHIWPRGSFMLIALPNLDGSFTVTLFLANDGNVSFAALDTDDKIMSFFQINFPDALTHMPDLLKDYHDNPVGKLGTLKCYPWHKEGKGLIMGDAAHAIVPFYGQGMNASFEDVTVFDECLQSRASSWSELFDLYQKTRKKDTDAIADLALDNYYEMRDHVDNVSFVKKRSLEMKLEQTFPDYYSKYSLVTFNENIPYAEAMKKGRRQDDLLLALCAEGEADKMDLDQVLNYLNQHV